MASKLIETLLPPSEILTPTNIEKYGLIITVSALPTIPGQRYTEEGAPKIPLTFGTIHTWSMLYKEKPETAFQNWQMILENHWIAVQAIGGVGNTETALAIAAELGAFTFQAGKKMREVARLNRFADEGDGFTSFLQTEVATNPKFDIDMDLLVLQELLAHKIVVLDSKIWALIIHKMSQLLQDDELHEFPLRYHPKLQNVINVLVDNTNRTANFRLWKRQEEKLGRQVNENGFTYDQEKKVETDRMNRWAEDFFRFLFRLYGIDYRRKSFEQIGNYRITTDASPEVLARQFVKQLQIDLSPPIVALIRELANENPGIRQPLPLPLTTTDPSSSSL